MRKSNGLILLLLASAGSVALYAFPRELTSLLGGMSSSSAADAQQFPVGSLPGLPSPSVAQRGTDPTQLRVFSPTTPLVDAAEPTSNAVRLAQAPVRAPDVASRPGGFVAPLSVDGSRRLASSKPGDDDARRELTRDLQKELKRVGCFDGEVNGTWSPASKKAMSAFMDRVNATLPVEDPDYILLTLVQGHAAQACGKGCPPGQGVASDGRCLPRAILAQSARKTDERKLVDRADKAKSPDAKAADMKTVDATPPIETGSLAKPPTPAVGPVVPLVPLAGRMAMGAPVATPDEIAKLDDLEARKRRAQAALVEEQKSQAKAQAEADQLKSERLIAEAQRRDQQLKAQALAEIERQKAERLSAEADSRTRQVAAVDARRAAQRQAEALEASAKANNVGDAPGTNNSTAPSSSGAVSGAVSAAGTAASTSDAAKVAAIAAAAVAVREVAAERRRVAQRVREARERDDQRDRRSVTASPPSGVGRRPEPRPEPRYVPNVSVARVAPRPTPRPAPEQRWTRTIFNDISRSR